MARMLRRLPIRCAFSALRSVGLFSVGIAGKLGDLRAERLDVGDDGAVEALVGGGLDARLVWEPLREWGGLS